MTTYRLSLDIPSSEKLGIIIAALAAEGVTFHITELDNHNPPKISKPQTHNIERSKAAKVIFNNVSIAEKVDKAKCIAKLEAAGFRGSTLSPTISRLCQAGYFKRNEDNSVERIR